MHNPDLPLLPSAPNAAAQWVWDSLNALEAPPRVSRVVFKLELNLAFDPITAYLQVSAGIDYRLFVNDEFAGSGPCRAYPDFWEYDAYKIEKLLRQGANSIEVEVRHHTVNTFHHVPMPPGFIAWGRIVCPRDTIEIFTPGAWKCLRRPGVDTTAPRLSFAQAPVEILDLRKDAAHGVWGIPTIVPHVDTTCKLRERTLPPLTRIPLAPASVKVAKAETNGWILGSRVAEYNDDRSAPLYHPKEYILRVQSPCDQTVTVGCWWGDYKFNWIPEKPRPDPSLPFSQLLDLPFKAGRNEIRLIQNAAFGYAENCVSLPAGKGLLLDHDKTPVEGVQPGAPFTPLRHIAWTTPGEYTPVAPGAEIIIPAGEKTLVTVDMGGITLALPRIEIEAPAGTVVDLAHAEEGDARGRPRVDRAVVMYSADRFILAAGETTLETLAPRGFRYLDILVSGHNAPVRIRSVGAMERRYPLVPEAEFECSDPDFNNLWKWAGRTLELCADDVFVDCPWRERTLYGGDMLSETGANAVFTRDLGCAKRSVEVFLQSAADTDGWLQSNAPYPREKAALLGDYAILTAITAGWYLRMTHDAAFARRAWPVFKRMSETVKTWQRPDGMYEPSVPAFIDHNRKIRAGATNGFNAAMRATFREWAVCAEYAGEPAEAVRMRELGDALDAKFNAVYFDPAARCYRDLPIADGVLVTEGSPANSWPLLFVDAAREKIPEILGALQGALDMFTPETENESVSPYQMFYYLNALRVAGAPAVALAEDSIRKVYGGMLKNPTGTIWESMRGGDSQTHAWSCGVAVWLATCTLGVGLGLTDPEELRKIILRPRSATLSWARGKIPHPLGMVEVEWKRKPDGTLDIRATAPQGVEVVVEAER